MSPAMLLSGTHAAAPVSRRAGAGAGAAAHTLPAAPALELFSALRQGCGASGRAARPQDPQDAVSTRIVSCASHGNGSRHTDSAPGSSGRHPEVPVARAYHAQASFSAYVAEELLLPKFMRDAASSDVVLTSWEPDEDEDVVPWARSLAASRVQPASRQKAPSRGGRPQHRARAPSSIIQGFATSKGPLKPSMQDYFVAVSDATGQSLWSMAPPEVAATLARRGGSLGPFVLTGIFDGHGHGDHAARTAQESTLQAIAGDPDVLASLGSTSEDDERTSSATLLDEQRVGAVAAAFRSAFARLDERICSEGVERELLVDGTTALVSVQVGPVLYTANAGDSRAVLCRDGAALRLSRDHKPELLAERRRIEAAGGRVANVRGTWRVVLPLPNGVSAKVCSVSRGLGDRDFKERRLISCEPDVAALVLQAQRDTFAIHASDGLWGAVADQEAVDVVRRVVEQFTLMKSLGSNNRQAIAGAAARELVRLAQNAGSVDDITVVVTLYGWD